MQSVKSWSNPGAKRLNSLMETDQRSKAGDCVMGKLALQYY